MNRDADSSLPTHQTDRHRNHVHNFIQFVSYNHANVPNFIPSGRANFRPLTNWPIEIKVSQQITLKRSELNCPRWRLWSIVPGLEDHWREIVDQVHSVFSCPNVSSLILFWFQFQSRALSQVHLNFSFLLSLDQEVERERWTSQRVFQGGSSRRRSWTRQTDRPTDRTTMIDDSCAKLIIRATIKININFKVNGSVDGVVTSFSALCLSPPSSILHPVYLALAPLLLSSNRKKRTSSIAPREIDKESCRGQLNSLTEPVSPSQSYLKTLDTASL